MKIFLGTEIRDAGFLVNIFVDLPKFPRYKSCYDL